MAGKKGAAAPTSEPATEVRGEAWEPTEAQATAMVVDEEVVSHSVVPRGTNAVASIDDVQALMLEDSEQDLGFEKGDVALPFFRVLQSNSPQAMKRNPKYVEGAEAGHFFNTATNRVYDGDKGIYAIAVHFTKQATLWKPRIADAKDGGVGGGGFVRPLDLNEAYELLKTCVKNDKNKDITPAGYKDPQGQDNGGLELSIAAMYYLLVLGENIEEGALAPEAVAFPMTSTQMKKSRSWNAIIQNSRLPHPSGTGSYRAPMFGYLYKLTTIPESNAKGEWLGVRIQQSLPLIKYADGGVPKEQFAGAASLYLAARDFKSMVAEGKVKVAEVEPEDVVVEGQGGSDDDVRVEEEKLPF
jgi:hypothetical protein